MLISEVSARYGLSTDTLRYYERIGLIPRVHRNESGLRDYTEQDCRWVEFVKCMRGAGLPIEALIEYVALFQRGEETLKARLEILTQQRDQLEARIQELQGTLKRLDFKIAWYDRIIMPLEKDLPMPVNAEAQAHR